MPQPTQDFLRIDHVTKRFADVVAVDNANLRIAQGEFFSLLGPSGCGKTTLLRMLAGFEQPSEGAIYIDGQSMEGVAANRRPTNMVFQSYAIFPHLNVFDNIAFGLRKARLPKAELTKRVEDALAMMRLTGLGKRGADELSGGQRQRVALARALVLRPKVLLLDEPLGALDKRLREAMQIELRQLQKSVGITFVFVTHDQEEALSMSDRIAVMSEGAVLQVDSPRALYEAPNCREVADFIGTINFFDASALENEPHGFAVDAGPLGRIHLPPAAVPERLRTRGAKMLLAIRPEKIRLSAKRHGEDHAVKGIVHTAAYLGERSHFHVSVEGLKDPIAIAAQNAEREIAGDHRSGATVYLSWQPDAVVVLEG